MRQSKSQILTASHEQIEIALLEKKDERGLLDFFASNLKTWGEFRQFWEWRQKGLPHSGGETAVIAKADEEMLGCVGIVPANITLNGERVTASWQQDSLVSPSMRGKGLGKRLVKEGAKGWDLVMSKGTNKPMYGLRKSLGFVDVPNPNYLVRVCKPRTTIRDLKKTHIEYVLCLWKTALPMPGADTAIQVKDVNEFDPTLDTLAHSLSKQNVFRLNKGQGYLNWRYFQCPGKRYKVFRAGGEQACGAIVLNITGAELDEGWIVDMICSHNDKNCAYALLLKAIRYFEEQCVSRIWAFSTLPAARKWLFRFGFVPTNQTPRFTYRVHGEGVDPGTLANATWDFWHGDGDIELYM